ncbi:MAG: YcjX family protein [Pseudoruegeria sp.]
MRIGDIADGVTRQVENLGATVSESLFEPTIRLGVTGLARAGKTVFITSLVANLLNRSRMSQVAAIANGGVRTVYLQPQPDDTIARFDYEDHLAALTTNQPSWPESTRSISELRLSFRVQPNGLLSGLSGPKTVHLDIVDYPGEWLLDLALMDQSYSEWSARSLQKAEQREAAAAYLAKANETDSAAKLRETDAKALAELFTTYLKTAQAQGYSDCSPGRFLLPGALEGSPVLTFAPLSEISKAPRGSLWREMERRYEAYKSRVVKPFFREHFARIDRQVVLVDVLGAIHRGPQAVENMRESMGDILNAFRPGKNSFLSRLLVGQRVEKILFAATKADHLHHSQHPQLTAIMDALVRDAKDKADFAGAQTSALSIAALRATVEETLQHNGAPLDCVRGTLLDTGKTAAFHAGSLPQDPARLLNPARERAEQWLDGDFGNMRFSPATLRLKPGEGLPHIRLDRATEFLIGDRLK